jgi:hypothetical protein
VGYFHLASYFQIFQKVLIGKFFFEGNLRFSECLGFATGLDPKTVMQTAEDTENAEDKSGVNPDSPRRGKRSILEPKVPTARATRRRCREMMSENVSPVPTARPS